MCASISQHKNVDCINFTRSSEKIISNKELKNNIVNVARVDNRHNCGVISQFYSWRITSYREFFVKYAIRWILTDLVTREPWLLVLSFELKNSY